MKKIKPLPYQSLRKKLAISDLRFRTTQEITSLTKFIGQDRAWEALQFGIRIKAQGYHLYAMGPSGIGKRSLVSSALNEYAQSLPTPPDWCYIHNFELPEHPIAIQLPAGTGNKLAHDMQKLIDTITQNSLAVFESDAYRKNIKKIRRQFELKLKKILKNKNATGEVNPQLYPYLYKDQYEKEKKLELSTVKTIVNPLIKKLKHKYEKFSAIIDYLNSVQYDITHHVNDFIKRDEKTNLLTLETENPVLIKYKVNVLVDNSKLNGAPVIFEDSPSYSTIICRIEYTAQQGTLMTNFSLIKSGSLHQANGGFLIISSRKFKKNHDAWESLKNAIFSNKICIKPIEHESDLFKPVTLKPAAIPLNVKIILIGDRNTYYSLCQNDKDFLELFKVAVDFDEQIEKNKKNIKLFARLIGTIVKRKKLRVFHASAVTAIIEYSSRLAEDSEKLSTHIRDIEDLILESDYWAGTKNKKVVDAVDVKHAIHAQVHRMDRARDLYYEDIHRHDILIKTTGKIIGQVNCLSVRKVGNFSYGHPTRVTAEVRLGRGKVIDIQREIKMAGPAHAKASYIISSFIASHFNQDQAFSLQASLSFEQIYCWTDGDSASVGEICALLSALADIPILQALAITGSIDQQGTVQAIGGVNEKIEGFFDICKLNGLHGSQGVIIPRVNQKNLILRDDVMAAIKAKQFAIYLIETIDDAIYLLTGIQAGKRNSEGIFPENTVYHAVENKLKKYALNRLR